jgi:hypothetical protein
MTSYHACGNLHRQAVTLQFLGRAQVRNGQPEQARNSWTQSAAIYYRLGDTAGEAQVRSALTAFTSNQNATPDADLPDSRTKAIHNTQLAWIGIAATQSASARCLAERQTSGYVRVQSDHHAQRRR